MLPAEILKKVENLKLSDEQKSVVIEILSEVAKTVENEIEAMIDRMNTAFEQRILQTIKKVE